MSTNDRIGNLPTVQDTFAELELRIRKQMFANDALEKVVAKLRTALENAEAERDDYYNALDEIADGVADPKWTAREALGRNE